MPGGADRCVALDTSVAVPLLVQSHSAHQIVDEWWQGRPVALSGHAVAETYAVLTRLPGDLRLDPQDAAHLITTRFETPALLDQELYRGLAPSLADLGVAGGATYDAIVALGALSNGCLLATRDARALSTYQAVGVDVEIVA